MKVAVRADATLIRASGHIMRCMTLGRALKEQGHDLLFVSRDTEGNLNDLLAANGFNVAVLPGGAEPTDKQQDAEQTIKALKKQKFTPDWLLIDHYDLDASWGEKMRSHSGRILVWDDTADRPHECDMIIDYTPYPDMEGRYRPLVPENTSMLLGPDYFPLRDEFHRARDNIKKDPAAPVKNIFVFFSGSDPMDTTSFTLRALDDLDRSDIEYHVVTGKTSPFKDKVYDLAKGKPNISIYEHVSNMAEFMAKADLCIGAGGTTTWERAAMGTPSLIIAVAENQWAQSQSAHDLGCAQYLGRMEDLAEADVTQAVQELIDNTDARVEMAANAKKIVDGNGTQRIVQNVTVFKP